MNIKCKIICINNKITGDRLTMGELSITIGKEYETYYELFNIDGDQSFIYLPIVDDVGYMRLYPRNFFMSKEEYRNQKLEDIGI
jgi:hypothetical protein